MHFIQVKDGDSLPPIICHRCVYKLDVLHNFREVSHKSDVILKQYLDYAKQLSSHDDQVVIKYFFECYKYTCIKTCWHRSLYTMNHIILWLKSKNLFNIVTPVSSNSILSNDAIENVQYVIVDKNVLEYIYISYTLNTCLIHTGCCLFASLPWYISNYVRYFKVSFNAINFNLISLIMTAIYKKRCA